MLKAFKLVMRREVLERALLSVRFALSYGATAVFDHPFLYGAILSFDKPGDYQIARIDALREDLGDVTGDFENLLTKDLPALNDALKAKGKEPIPAPPAKVALNEHR